MEITFHLTSVTPEKLLEQTAEPPTIGRVVITYCDVYLPFKGAVGIQFEDGRMCQTCVTNYRQCYSGEGMHVNGMLAPKREKFFAFIEGFVPERCVIPSCDAETPYEVTTPIDQRAHYVEGSGQLCQKCFMDTYGE